MPPSLEDLVYLTGSPGAVDTTEGSEEDGSISSSAALAVPDETLLEVEVADYDPEDSEGDFVITSDTFGESSEDTEEQEGLRTIARPTKVFSVDLPRSTLVHPALHTASQLPDAPELTEAEVLQKFLPSMDSSNEWTDIVLHNFSIYIDSEKNGNEMRSLHCLSTKNGPNPMYFNGVLEHGDIRHYVRKVPFRELPIGNYGETGEDGEDASSINGQIWIRSLYNENREVYYRLTTPSIEYKRFFTPFLWVADLGKHFVDYCDAIAQTKRPVYIRNFQSEFSEWLHRHHGDSLAFQRWRAAFGRDDFRTAVVANIDHLWKETNNIMSEFLDRRSKYLPIFQEILSLDRFQQEILPCEDTKEIRPTVVTRYIYNCFKHMQLGKILQPVASEHEKSTAEPVIGEPFLQTPAHSLTRKDMIDNIRLGDVISTSRDGLATGTKWKIEASKHSACDDKWYGLVQGITVNKRGLRLFDVAWLYHPIDTPCRHMRYPWKKELFLSDHCTCDEGPNSNIEEDEVFGTHSVEWFGGPTTIAEFFIRQMYMHGQRRWVTLKKSDLECCHRRKDTATAAAKYAAGDTVLAQLGHSARLEPVEVARLWTEDFQDFVSLRILLRRAEIEPGSGAPANELVYTDEFVTAHVSAITARCTLRTFDHGSKIPTPYDRNGVGNIFYATSRRVSDGETVRYERITHKPSSLRQGFDPDKPCAKLAALDLFCGCGNFGRGLEESGVIEVKWANDMSPNALHTYMANTRSPEAVWPFLGSVDNLLRSGLEGLFSKSVPAPGEVAFISGGSPCPGFSLLTPNKQTPLQAKNRSLVASFASFIDFYRPRYGILENVPTIVEKGPKKSEDCFSQLICALLGLGYQAEIMLGNAWSHGAPQKRSRVFLLFAAPGVRLPSVPSPSHSHYPGYLKRGKRRLGRLSNDEPYIEIRDQATAFSFVSSEEATKDLPDIQEGKPGICVRFPDHRLSVGVTRQLRAQIQSIPTQPYGMGFAKAWYGQNGKEWTEGQGVMTAAERACFPPKGVKRVSPESHGWTRVDPRALMSTVTTSCAPTDARVGRWLHWRQQRPLTIMEVRRAQGIPDDEVLLGSPADMWRSVGNSVARQIATALGLAFREAWLGSLCDEPHGAAEDAGVGRTAAAVDTGAALDLEITEADSETTDSATEKGDSGTDEPPAAARGSLTPSTSTSGSERRTAMKRRLVRRSEMFGSPLAKRFRESPDELGAGGADSREETPVVMERIWTDL
ncbi:uncharacterized protein E0L32_002697 [Thyridium curvatum]|uniref:DNA (cytosine-5-)-methyltransferase n=1 Tax=Thyridium curvatum TaxID=1093900 RepID=A0A507BN30_9PEZI|nr:uncharacterized protein E0L32_002697 [Thyridium curvatum]TPX18188.1 hypothetical protein E0L32_002697 [Thyridium curvatum]